MIEYTEPYVKFFLHRNGLINIPDIERIEEETFKDPRISAILEELER